MELRYRAEITAGSLKVRESRIIADLLLRQVSGEDWDRELFDNNILQTKSRKTAERLVQLLRPRLETMGEELWKLIRDGSSVVAAHACLAAAVKHSALLGDFLDMVVREQYRLRNPALPRATWHRYIEDCQARDAEMSDWSESTIERLRSSVFQILAQAGYLENTRSLKLQTVHISREVLRYLHDKNESYVLRCIQVSP
jgi:hypothetical protein